MRNQLFLKNISRENTIQQQTFLKEIRFSIKLDFQARKSYTFSNFPQRNSIWNKLKFSEWKKQARNSYNFANSPQRNSILESNSKFLKEKCIPKIPITSQTLLNEIRFRINLKVSEWKMQAKNSYNSWNR